MTAFNETKIREIMANLAQERPRFCSEADLQFVLFEKIQKEFPQAEIRFECPAIQNGSNIYIDTIVNLDSNLFPIELKMPLKSDAGGNETNQRDSMKDNLERLAKLQKDDLQLDAMYFAQSPKAIKNCFAIWLTDNKNHCNKEYGKHTVKWESYGTDDTFWFAVVGVLE
jgi:hypothetical protein